MNYPLPYLKTRLSKEDFNIVMAIYMTPTDELIKEARQSWFEEDIRESKEIKEQIKTVNKIYNKNINNIELSKINREILNILIKNRKEINARIKNNPAGKRTLRRYLVGNKEESGKTRDPH